MLIDPILKVLIWNDGSIGYDKEILEIRCTLPKEDIGIQKIMHFFGREGKEYMGIPKIFDQF